MGFVTISNAPLSIPRRTFQYHKLALRIAKGLLYTLDQKSVSAYKRQVLLFADPWCHSWRGIDKHVEFGRSGHRRANAMRTVALLFQLYLQTLACRDDESNEIIVNIKALIDRELLASRHPKCPAAS